MFYKDLHCLNKDNIIDEQINIQMINDRCNSVLKDEERYKLVRNIAMYSLIFFSIMLGKNKFNKRIN